MRKFLKNKVCLALVLVAGLLMVTLPAAAQNVDEASDAEQARAEKLMAIEADKEAFAQEIAAKFDLPARVADTLGEKDAETLLEMSGVASFEEYIGLQTTTELVLYPLKPCRIVDTRNASRWGFNPIPGGGTITIDTWVPWQGGQGGAANCGVISDSAAVVLNVTAVPTGGGDGFLTVWPYGQSRPLASLVNYNGNATTNAVANSVVQSQCRSCSHELNIYAWRTTHVVVDVIGYFARPSKTRLDNYQTFTSAVVPSPTNFHIISPVCPSGYRITGGGFLNNVSNINFVHAGSRGIKGTSFAVVSGANQIDRYICQGRNQKGSSDTVWCFSVCGRQPGR